MERKTALITGCSKGIGKRIALDLAEKGCNIVINYRNSKSEAENLLQKINGTYGGQAICVQGDVARQDDVSRIIDESLQAFSSIDILVNNAGPFIFERKKLLDYSMEEWHEIIHGNLSSVFYLCKLVIPGMRQKSWGRIINFGFNQAEAAPAWETRSVYAAAKAGLVSLTRTLALEEAEYGITVNMVTLGDIVHPWKELKIDDVKKVQNDGTPVGRMGSGEDVTRVISFLCDENSDFLTGGIIPITGGKTSFV